MAGIGAVTWRPLMYGQEEHTCSFKCKYEKKRKEKKFFALMLCEIPNINPHKLRRKKYIKITARYFHIELGKKQCVTCPNSKALVHVAFIFHISLVWWKRERREVGGGINWMENIRRLV